MQLKKVADGGAPVDATVMALPSKEGAVALYLADAKIKAALDGRAASAPVALQLTAGESFGGAVNEYLVLSTYDATPPGALDVQITHAVFGHVLFHPEGASVALATILPR